MTGFTNGLLGPMTTTAQQKSYARTNLALGIGDSPTWTAAFLSSGVLNLGASSDAKVIRSATGPTIDLLAAGGLRSRNYANSADAPISGSTGTLNQIVLSGNIASAAWTTSGLRIKGITATLTDTTSTGTVAAAYTDVLGGNTIAASGTVTFTDYITAFFKEPTAGTGVTFTNKWALGSESLRVGTSNQMTVTNAGAVSIGGTLGVTGAATFSGDIVQSTGGFLHRLNGNNSALSIVGAADINNGASIQLRGNSIGSNNGTVIFRRGTGSSTVDTLTIDGTTSNATFAGSIALGQDGSGVSIYLNAGGGIRRPTGSMYLDVPDNAGFFYVRTGASYLTRLTIDGAGAATFTGNIVGNGDATIGSSGNRQISLSSGNGIVTIKGAATGGYAHQFGFLGNAGTALGGYGIVGSGDALTNFWIGQSNSSPYMTLTSSLVATSVGSFTLSHPTTSATYEAQANTTGTVVRTAVQSQTTTGRIGTISNHPVSFVTNNTTAGTVDISGNLAWIGVVTGQAGFKIGTAGTAPQLFGFSASTPTSIDNTGSGLSIYSQNNAAGSFGLAFTGTAQSQTSGVNGAVYLVRSFNPTSGTATHTSLQVAGTINQTGGASGITRFVLLAPSLTAAADFRALEINDVGSHYAIKTGTGLVNFGDSVTMTSSYNIANTINHSGGSSASKSLWVKQYGNSHDPAGAYLDLCHLGGSIASPAAPTAGHCRNSLSWRTGGSNAALFTNPSFSIRHTIVTVGSSLCEVDTDFMVNSTASGTPRTALTLKGNSDAAIFAGSVTTGGNVTVGATRPVVLDGTNGFASVKGSAGGWDLGYKFIGYSGTNNGGFGANGSADSLSYFYIGSTYSSPVAAFAPASGNVGIGMTQPYTKLDVAAGYINSQGPTYGFTLGRTTGLTNGVAILHHSSGDTTGNTQLLTNLGGLRLGVEGNTAAVIFSKTTGDAAFSGAVTVGATRPITLNGGSGFISQTANAGGWDMNLRFIGSAATNLGGFGATGTSDTLTNLYIGPNYSSPYATFGYSSGTAHGIGTSTPSARWDIVYTSSLSSGTSYGQKIQASYSQTGNAQSTDLLINRIESTIGSGAHNFIDMQLAGASKARIDRTGLISTIAGLTITGTAVTRSIIIGDTGSDGSELQITNGTTGGVILGRFNATTGFITPLNVQASGALCAGGHTPATYGSAFKLQVSGRSIMTSYSSTTGLSVLTLDAQSTSAAIQSVLKCQANASTHGEIYLENSGNGATRFYALAIGTGDAQSTFAVNGGVAWSSGLDQSDSSSFVLSKASTLGTSNVFRVDATSLSMSLYDGLSFATVAKGITYKSGTNARAGNATLVAGTVTIANTSVTANTIVIYCVKTLGGTPGNLSYTLSAGVSLTINSDNPLDTSTISYQLIELV